VALLHLLSRLRRSLKLSLGAVYVNHRMRPRAARKEEQFCRQLCDDLTVPLTIVTGDVPALAKKNKQGLEETARELRYAVFEHLAETDGYDKVALGHHADDQVETILFRLIRGTGPSGLRGMPPKRGKIIRPLLDLTRAEVIAYLKKQSLACCEDRSNLEIKFKRNYIRQRLLPAVRKNLNPQVGSALLSLADTVAGEDEFLEAIVDRSYRKVVRISPGGKITLALDSYRGYATWLRRRLVRRCLKATCPDGQFPAKEVVERIDWLAGLAQGSVSLPGQVQAVVVDASLLIFRRVRRSVRAPYQPGKKLELSWPNLSFTGSVLARSRSRPKRQARSKRVWLDWDKVTPPLEVRSVKPGDRFRPLGMKGHKKIGNFLTDRKVPRPMRDELLLLCDRQGPIWLVGFEIDERVKIDDQTKKVLTVAVSVRKTAGRTAL
jgi:tRNA(Ile)-lysidine synthase